MSSISSGASQPNTKAIQPLTSESEAVSSQKPELETQDSATASQYEKVTSGKTAGASGMLLAGLGRPSIGMAAGVLVGAGYGVSSSRGQASVDILQVGGRVWSPTFARTESATKANGYKLTETMNATKSEFKLALGNADLGDIVVTFGHSIKDPITGEVLGLKTKAGFMGLGSADMLTGKEISRALRDADPAGVVFLAGCETESLLDDVIAGGAKIAFGFTREIGERYSADATDAVISALVGGASVSEAVTAGNRRLGDVGANGAQVVFRIAEGVDTRHSLIAQKIY